MFCLRRVCLESVYLKGLFLGGATPRRAFLGGDFLEGAYMEEVSDFVLEESDSVGSSREMLSSRGCVWEDCALKWPNLVWSV